MIFHVFGGRKLQTIHFGSCCKFWLTNIIFPCRSIALICSVKWPLILTLLVCSSCYHLRERSAVTTEVHESPRLPFLDSVFIAQANLIAPRSVSSFYKAHNYSLLWSDTSGLRAFADTLLDIVRSSEKYGLVPNDYHLLQIDSLLNSPTTDETKIALDAFFTDSFFALRHHLKCGRLDSAGISKVLSVDKIDSSGIDMLSTREGQTKLRHGIESQEPMVYQYQMLRDTLGKILAAGLSDSVSTAHVRQIAINMERWRWVQEKPSRFISVNIPEFVMHVVDGDSIILESNVIVGKPENATPVLTSVVKSFIIYPYWHVPRGIATKEMLPLIKKDSLYLRDHNFEVLDPNGQVVADSAIDWASLNKNNFPYILRQREGSDNALGIIKFSFANNFGVYLHDTNSRRLFSKEKRALSHGCVRVHKAIQLAHYLVKDDNVYVSPEDLDQYLTLHQRVEVKIVKPIPLFIEYFTCEYKNGKVNFYQDIYKKDEQLINALYYTPPMNTSVLLAAN
jgi:murein L,D-transpeptidase YcbB/YkuD